MLQIAPALLNDATMFKIGNWVLKRVQQQLVFTKVMAA